jgi:hypothetical protein
MLPTKTLYERSRMVSLVRLPSEDGMDPKKLHRDKSRHDNWDNCEIFKGISPEKLEKERSRCVNLERLRNWGGIEE